MNIPKIPVKLCFGILFFILFIILFIDYLKAGITNWSLAYFVAILACFIYLYLKRENYFAITWLIIVFNLIGITLPVMPAIFFFNEITDELKKSIYIHSWGILLFISFLLFFSPNFGSRKINKGAFQSSAWHIFFNKNKIVFLLTLPFVVVLLLISGAWKVYLGLENSDFSRIADLKGLGPLMLLSYINVISGAFICMNFFLKKKHFKGFLFFLFIIFLNNIGYGRGNLISTLCLFYFFYGMVNRFSYKIPLAIFTIGFLIVMLQFIRHNHENSYESQILVVLLKFTGDFPEVFTTSKLLEYLKYHNFFGGQIIWGNLWYYVPRVFYQLKPQVYGGLELTYKIFPGLYSGKDGGSSTTFGLYGTLYSMNGIISLVLGLLVLSFLISYFENKIFKWIKNPIPKFFVVYYIIFLGSCQVLHREGFLALFNSLNQTLMFTIVTIILTNIFYAVFRSNSNI